MSTPPETPFNGVVVARDVSHIGTGATKVSLIIMEEGNPGKPAVVLYTIIAHDKPQPSLSLRVGHKVRVKTVSEERGFIYAQNVSFNLSQFAVSLGAPEKESKRESE